MTLLAQTAGRTALIYWPATSAYGTFFNGLALLEVSQAVISNGTVAYGTPFNGAVNRLRSLPPIVSLSTIWTQQVGLSPQLNLLIGFGFGITAGTPTKRVSGVFQDQNSLPIARVGFLYDRATGAYLTTFNSSAIDGSWTGYVPSINPVFVVMVPAGADSRNAVVLDNLVPV